MEVGSAETTLNGGSADPMPVSIGDALINYYIFYVVTNFGFLETF